eukprot:1374492-Lingulodinium_polyedra.AAC.1
MVRAAGSEGLAAARGGEDCLRPQRIWLVQPAAGGAAYGLLVGPVVVPDDPPARGAASRAGPRGPPGRRQAGAGHRRRAALR